MRTFHAEVQPAALHFKVQLGKHRFCYILIKNCVFPKSSIALSEVDTFLWKLVTLRISVEHLFCTAANSLGSKL